MKKILLTSILSIIGFIGFSSAGSITFLGSESFYTPSQITFVSDGSFDVGSYSCNKGLCTLDFCYGDDINSCCGIQYDGGSLETFDCEEIPAGTYELFYNTEDFFDSITLSSSSFEDNTGGGNGGDDNTGGGTGGDYNMGGIIDGGTSTFTPIINGLTTLISEFLPYVVYIGLGLLSAIIGFVAIKRLMNWIRAKVLGTFSSGKRK